jgi:hypothetical protein
MKHTIDHELGRERALEIALEAWEEYRLRFAGYQPELSREGEYRAWLSFRAKGIGVRGRIEVRDREIEIEFDVPLLLKPFRKMAVAAIEREVARRIALAESARADGE